MKSSGCRSRHPGVLIAISHILLLAAAASTSAAPATASAAASDARRIIDAEHVVAIQQEAEDPATGRYDWGPSVMKDGDLYRMWWVRLGGANQQRFPYATKLDDGTDFEFTYPDRGDRIYYAESRDGLTWHLTGDDYTGPVDAFGPDAAGPLLVLKPAETSQERMHLGCPSVIKVDGTFYLYSEACCDFICTRGPDGKVAVGNEYHNQVFVATSTDGKTWSRWPSNDDPQPIIPAPAANKLKGRRRYGIGQPSACYRDGTFILHVVDSCTGPGDFIVRIEADNPFFRHPRVFRHKLQPSGSTAAIPAGSVARFAQTDVKYLGDLFCLLRPAYGTGHLNLLSTRSGVFAADADARLPRDVYPQVRLDDPRGDDYRERLYPRFLTDPHGQILLRDGAATIFYATGRGFKDAAYTWDLRRADIAWDQLPP